MSPDSLVPVPLEIQHRAWECAVALLQDYPRRLNFIARAYLRVVEDGGPDRITWHRAANCFRAWRNVVEARV